MKLNLQPYDPTGDLRGRAAAALASLSTEWATAPDPSIPKDMRDDAEERARAAARKWRRTAGGRENNRRRMAARREAKLAAKIGATRGN